MIRNQSLESCATNHKANASSNRDEIKRAYPELFSKHALPHSTSVPPPSTTTLLIASPRARSSFLDDVDLDSLRLSRSELDAVQRRCNAQMTATVPCDHSADASTSILVCDDARDADRFVVIKQMKKSKLRMGELSECRLDLKVHAHLQSERLSVVALLGWFEDAQRLCSLFEFAHNGDLLSVLNAAPSPSAASPSSDAAWLSTARRGMRDIAATLAHLHSHGAAHKDLTLDNVLVDARRRFLLHDFALLELFAGDDDDEGDDELARRSSTMSAQWSGKREHMSPENYLCFKGDRELFDAAKNDVFGALASSSPPASPETPSCGRSPTRRCSCSKWTASPTLCARRFASRGIRSNSRRCCARSSICSRSSLSTRRTGSASTRCCGIPSLHRSMERSRPQSACADVSTAFFCKPQIVYYFLIGWYHRATVSRWSGAHLTRRSKICFRNRSSTSKYCFAENPHRAKPVDFETSL